MKFWTLVLTMFLLSWNRYPDYPLSEGDPVIRINQLGYKPESIKVAVWASVTDRNITTFELIDASNNKIVFTGSAGNSLGSYGPFVQSYRLNFSTYKSAGRYYLKAGEARSPEFRIGNDIYKGTA